MTINKAATKLAVLAEHKNFAGFQLQRHTLNVADACTSWLMSSFIVGNDLLSAWGHTQILPPAIDTEV